MNFPRSVDVAVVGGGHNGLVCANYLLRAGHSVALFERRPLVGGAVCTGAERCSTSPVAGRR